MKIEDIKVGMFLQDRWYPEWGFGEVVKVLKTVIHINFSLRGKEKYDKSHVQWLEKPNKDFFKERV